MCSLPWSSDLDPKVSDRHCLGPFKPPTGEWARFKPYQFLVRLIHAWFANDLSMIHDDVWSWFCIHFGCPALAKTKSKRHPRTEKGTQAENVVVIISPEDASYFGEIKSFNPMKGHPGGNSSEGLVPVLWGFSWTFASFVRWKGRNFLSSQHIRIESRGMDSSQARLSQVRTPSHVDLFVSLS